MARAENVQFKVIADPDGGWICLFNCPAEGWGREDRLRETPTGARSGAHAVEVTPFTFRI